MHSNPIAWPSDMGEEVVSHESRGLRGKRIALQVNSLLCMRVQELVSSECDLVISSTFSIWEDDWFSAENVLLLSTYFPFLSITDELPQYCITLFLIKTGSLLLSKYMSANSPTPFKKVLSEISASFESST